VGEEDTKTLRRELRRTTRLLTETQRLANVGSWEWDLRTNAVQWSPQLRQIFGESDDFVPSPESFRDRVHPRDLERMQWMYSSTREAGFDEPIEFRIIRADGKTRDVYLVSRSVHDRNGALVGYVGTIQDISDRKRLEQQALQSQKMEAIGRLAGGVAHDFNNVLMAILANASVLQLDNDCQEVRDIMRAADDGAGLARQLLALSRQSAISFETLDLNQLCHATLHLVERVLGDDIDIELSLAEGAWQIHGAVVQLKQLLLNLCINARDAMPSGGCITIETHNAVIDEDMAASVPGLRAGSYVKLVIADTGIGMDEETRMRAFEPFFTTKKEGKGTGLGLSTVFAVVKQSNGSIEIISSPGQGTRFEVYLPRAATRVATPEIRPPPDRSAVIGTETILVVEDNPMVATSIGRVLAQAGYRVVHAERPSEAFAALDREGGADIRALISDYLLPEMRGTELAKKLAERGCSLPVVFVSGFAPADDERMDVSNARFLQKPFHSDALLTVLRESLDGS